MIKLFEMTEEQHAALLIATQPAPMVALQCGNPPTQQEQANAAWGRLGEEMGFKPMTVRSAPTHSDLFFYAEPSE